jgi:signal transduction histidine kinase
MAISIDTSGSRVFSRLLAAAALVVPCLAPEISEAAAAEPGPPGVLLTNVLQLRDVAARQSGVNCSVSLEGVVTWASPGQDQFILQDESGGIRIQMDLRGQRALRFGERVRVEGGGVAGRGYLRETLVDNDGLHGPYEVSETIYLTKGSHPLCADWFNGPSSMSFEVGYEGPGVPRQPIPSAALFRVASGVVGGPSNLVQGLDYRCYEGNWARFPSLEGLVSSRTGTVTNFDLAARTREEGIAIRFTGFVQVPSDGVYAFSTRSDDGSRLSIGDTSLRLKMIGKDLLPNPRRISPGQALSETDDCRWTEVEGTLASFHFYPNGGGQAMLLSESNHMYLDIADVAGVVPELPGRMRVRGVARRVATEGTNSFTVRLMIANLHAIESLVAAPRQLVPHAAKVAELRRLAASGQRVFCPVRIEGQILAASSARNLLALQDDSGAALIETDFQGHSFESGQQIVLEGTCSSEGKRLRVRAAPLVANDGIHTLIEKSGAVSLRAGKQPIHLSWFNHSAPSGLEVYWQGPGLSRQKIPDSALFHAVSQSSSGAFTWNSGLGYRCYHGFWQRLPDSSLLEPVLQGVAPNFDVREADRAEHVAIEFDGFLEVPRDGVYTFSTLSDDGSQLFLDEQPTRLSIVGRAPLPAPLPVAARQVLRSDEQDRWAEVEGRVSFASRGGEGLVLELTSGTGHMRLEVADDAGYSSLLLLNSRVRALGISEFDYVSDGQRVAGTLLVPSLKQVEILELDVARWNDYPRQPIASLLNTNFPDTVEAIVHVRGKLRSQPVGKPMVIADDTGQLFLETTQPLPGPEGVVVEALGRWSRTGSNVVLRCGFYRPADANTDAASTAPPFLATIEQVKRLSREEAQRGYPVKIRGIITSPLNGGFFIQDATWAIYVRWPGLSDREDPRAGDYWEVEGETFVEFAPNILAHRAERLGTGTLPTPLRPTWDQLINGSLDTRYVEVQGIVTAVDSEGMALLTRAGKIKVQLSGVDPQSLRQYENGLIRVRGCVIPGRNAATQEVELGHILLSNSSINLDEPPPSDPFAANLKSTSDLLLFDVSAGAIQRVKLAGQIVHVRDHEYFLMEGTNGFRFVPKTAVDVEVGEQVEVVGFADLGGPSPVLREAVVRRTGRGPLPAAVSLTEDSLRERLHDATLVRIGARLINLGLDRAGQVLELQTGARGFVARLDRHQGQLGDLAPGCRLQLTGVFAGKGGDPASARDLDSFELLLNSPDGVEILTRPSWWTLRRTLTVVSAMTLLILGALAWITVLRRQVEERSRLLTLEVERREYTERQRALEQERARIAQDLHDDLGATLTQIRFLSALESRDTHVPPSTRTRMSQVSEKSRELVASLDEIVWAVNPANDSLPQLAIYLCQFAEEFFRHTTIRCRLDLADTLPQIPLNSELRHHVYLAVREALNNIAKHSAAGEVWLRILPHESGLRITIEDDGHGFDTAAAPPGEGLMNMRRRLEKVGGTFECTSRPGSGTVCRFWLPLEVPAAV